MRTTFIDGVAIEEQAALTKELLNIIDNEDKESFLPIMRKLTTGDVKGMSAENIEGILFEHCALTEN